MGIRNGVERGEKRDKGSRFDLATSYFTPVQSLASTGYSAGTKNANSMLGFENEGDVCFSSALGT